MRGIEFDALGARHTIRLDFNALCQIEAEIGPVGDVAMRLANERSLVLLRQVFRAGLGPAVTLEQAGDIIGDLGMERAGDLLGKAMALAFPDAAGSAGADNPAGKVPARK